MYIHQVHNFGLGNFINCTAAIERLSKIHNRPIDVYFDLPFVADCFRDCSFIDILDVKPKGEPLFTSVLTGTNWNTRPDYQFIFETVTGEKWNGQRCYVDEPKEFEAINNFCLKGKIAAFVQGSGNESKAYLDTKTIPEYYFLKAIEAARAKGLTPVFVGSENDLKRNSWANNMAHVVGDIRKALAVISQSELVVGNDSGLIHAAGAMNKRTFVFWKDTQAPRCFNSGENSTYLFKSEWDRISQLIEGLK